MATQKKHVLIASLSVTLIAGLLGSGISASPTRTVKKLQKIYGKNDNYICVSIPKAGTHLAIKALTLLDIEGIKYNYNTEKNEKSRVHDSYQKMSVKDYANRAFSRLAYRLQKNKSKRKSFLVHLPYTPKYEPFFKNCTKANFLIIRDPRDQLISLAATSIKDPLNREKFLQEIMLDLLQGTEKQRPWSPRHGGCDLLWSVGIVKFYEAFLKWAEQPNFYIVRFERLIGEQGGGTTQAQIQELKNMAAHLGATVSDEKINEVVNNLFGETRTFKQGQTASWKKYFTPEVTAAFKKVPGACKLLIDLGYETDDNW